MKKCPIGCKLGTQRQRKCSQLRTDTPTDDDPIYGNHGDDYPVGAPTLFVGNESLRSLFTETSSRNQNSLGQTLLRSIGFFISSPR
jgi:hypothetical protein